MVIPMFKEPQFRRILYGPDLRAPSEVEDDGVYVNVPETWIDDYKVVHSSKVIRLEGMHVRDLRLIRNRSST